MSAIRPKCWNMAQIKILIADKDVVEGKLLCKCSADLLYPIGVTSNSHGDIIVADTGHHCLKLFSADGKYCHEFGHKVSISVLYRKCSQKRQHRNFRLNCCHYVY